MAGLFALIEKKEISSFILKTAVDYALTALVHRGQKRKMFFGNKETGIGEVYAPNASASFAVATCFSSKEERSHWAIIGNCLLVFEGTLFNRHQLIDKNRHRFFDSKFYFDAEIALQSYLCEGTNAFASFEGYWSLITVDANEQKIYAACDHFGNSSLFYCQTDTQMGIASENNILFSILKNSGTINQAAVTNFLLWGDIAKQGYSFFSDIHRLTSAHYLEYSLKNNTIEKKPYYSLPYKNCKGGYNPYEEPFHIDTVRKLVLETIGNNLKDKNKVAVKISSGINAMSLFYSAVKSNLESQIIAVLPTYPDMQQDFIATEKAVKKTGMDWITIPFSSLQIKEQLTVAVQKRNNPVSDVESLMQLKVMETIKGHGIDAVMEGDGGDELFGSAIYFLPFLKSLRSQWMFKDWIKEACYSQNAGMNYKTILFSAWNNKLKNCLYRESKIIQKSQSQLLQFLNREYTTAYNLVNHYSSNVSKEVLNDYLFESYTQSLPYFLGEKEHTAARFGLDSLMPFSNSVKLAESVFSIPSTFKIHTGWDKYLLRSALISIVPDEIRWKKTLPNARLAQKWLYELNKDLKKRIQLLNDPEACIDKLSLLNLWDVLYVPTNYCFQQFVFRYCSYLLWRNGLIKTDFVR
jgi:asparagine synthase (glutamine-hydrolysing)